ncbi:MAG: hypothetical protein IT317_08255 [Anaerolineales bacterium]|nr:hypothetical protein [Anaerolineales bacterium]
MSLDLAPHHKHGLSLANPLLNAAGTLGFAQESGRLVNLRALGGFVTNPLTYRPRTAAHTPNAVALPEGVLIHTGLPNPGVAAALRRWDRDWRRFGPPVIVHLAATTPAETSRSLELLERANGVAGIELGARDDVSAAELGQLVRAALGAQPLLVRLPQARAAALAAAAAQAGADALVVAAPPRTEIRTGAPGSERLVSGRHYGPATFAAALEALAAVAAQTLGLPLVGAGGVFTGEQARAMLAAGALAIQLDAVLWTQPNKLGELLKAVNGGPAA